MPSTTEEQQTESSEFHTYKAKSAYPSGTPSATIYFDGLSCICFDGSVKCTVGINNTDSSHILQFGVWNTAGGGKVDMALPGHYREVQIEVKGPVEDGVYVYAPPSGAPTINDRYSYVDYYPDFESPKFHDKVLTKIPSALWPRFRINHGLFSSYKLSRSEFALKCGNGQQELGRVALGLVADIFLSATGSIEFIVDGRRLSTPVLRHPNRYEIGITNSAAGCSGGRTNDFQLNYQAVYVPTDERFELVTTKDSGHRGHARLGTYVDRGNVDPGETDRCDPFPCVGMGCGRTRSL